MGVRPGVNEDGNFKDSRATRKDSVEYPTGSFVADEWIVTANANVADMNPRSWVGAGTSLTVPPTDPPVAAGGTASPSVTESGVPSATATNAPTAFECVKIQDVQGNGWSSPMATQVKKVCGGYVTSILEEGFYIQDPNPEKNMTFSSGLYVYTGTNDKGSLAVGDSVEVLGEIKEVSQNHIISKQYISKL